MRAPSAAQLFRAFGLCVVVAATSLTTLFTSRALERQRQAPEHGEHGEHEEHGEHAEHAEHGEEGHPTRVTLTPEAREHAALELAEAGPGRVFTTLKIPGEIRLNADRVAHVTPRVGGTVREVHKDLGDTVTKGEILGLLDSRELATLLRDARSTSERVKLAEANFERVDSLFKEKIVPERDHLAAKQALAEARIDLEAAESSLVAAGGAEGRAGYSLRAPLDGTIIEKQLSVGEVLKDDTRVFVVADLSTVWVDLHVYPRDLPKVQVGQRVRVVTEGADEPREAVIILVSAVASAAARSTIARAVLDNPNGRFKPGLFVSADIGVADATAPVVVPDEAVQNIGGKPVVFVAGEENEFEAREVVLGRFGLAADGSSRVTEIAKGLAPGERYVLKNAFTLKAELGKSEGGHDH